VKKVYSELVGDFAVAIRRAQELGELDPSADPDQVLFELDSLLLGANIALLFFGDRSAPDRARAAVRDRIERWSQQPAR
jgi:hypothetical protein